MNDFKYKDRIEIKFLMFIKVFSYNLEYDRVKKILKMVFKVLIFFKLLNII